MCHSRKLYGHGESPHLAEVLVLGRAFNLNFFAYFAAFLCALRGQRLLRWDKNQKTLTVK
jgi:hypothetical protein